MSLKVIDGTPTEISRYLREHEQEKEVGVWIVYDLEANRKIQELLTKEGFSFRFDPSLEITNRYAKSGGGE